MAGKVENFFEFLHLKREEHYNLSGKALKFKKVWRMWDKRNPDLGLGLLGDGLKDYGKGQDSHWQVEIDDRNERKRCNRLREAAEMRIKLEEDEKENDNLQWDRYEAIGKL